MNIVQKVDALKSPSPSGQSSIPKTLSLSRKWTRVSCEVATKERPKVSCPVSAFVRHMRNGEEFERCATDRTDYYLGESFLTISSATARKSRPVMSGFSASGYSTLPGRAMKAAEHPARIAPSTSQAWAATSRSCAGLTRSSVAT
jgi:hypothetical protein